MTVVPNQASESVSSSVTVLGFTVFEFSLLIVGVLFWSYYLDYSDTKNESK